MKNIDVEEIKYCKVCKDELVTRVNSTIKNCINCGETYTFEKVDKINPIAFAEWTQLKGWGLLDKNKWINKNSEVVSSEVLFDMYSNKVE